MENATLGGGAQIGPPDTKLLSRTVADWVASRIVRGELQPGERLHENRIAQEANVSRSPVREALRLLASEGLVEIVPRLGAHVANVSPEDASHLYRARLLVEPECFRTAVEAMSEVEARELDEIHREMEAAAADGDAHRFLDHNIEYNRRLTSFCPNPVLRELVETTWTRTLRYWSLLIRLPNYVELSVQSNQARNQAVQALDADATEATARDVLTLALQQILASFEDDEVTDTQ